MKRTSESALLWNNSVPRDTNRNPTAKDPTGAPHFESLQEVDRWVPGAHYHQDLLFQVMEGHVKVSVHCCVCAGECTALVNKGVTVSRRKKITWRFTLKVKRFMQFQFVKYMYTSIYLSGICFEVYFHLMVTGKMWGHLHSRVSCANIRRNLARKPCGDTPRGHFPPSPALVSLLSGPVARSWAKKAKNAVR